MPQSVSHAMGQPTLAVMPAPEESAVRHTFMDAGVLWDSSRLLFTVDCC